MYSNFGAPRNGYRANASTASASTAQPPGHFWPHQPPSPSPAYFQRQDFSRFQNSPRSFTNAEASGSFPYHPPRAPVAPSDEISEQELTAILSEYALEKKSHEKSPKLNVSSIAQLFSDYKRLIQNVDSTVKYLEVTKKTLSDEDWAAKCNELEQKKELLSEVDKQLSDPAFLEIVSKTVNRVKAKRNRIKRRKAAWKEKKKELLEIREEKHKKIDLWLEKMKDEVERAHRAEMVKKEADLVLSDVTLKKNEAKRILGLLNSLVKLRAAKLQQLPANQRVSEEETKSFNLVVEKLKNMWAKQLKEYNLEEQGLKVMLNDAEVERVSTEEKSWRQTLNLWTETLFGGKHLFDPLQAQPTDFEHFSSVRGNWDKFVAAEESMLSSSIPVGWVIPVKPSRTEWECCLRGT